MRTPKAADGLAARPIRPANRVKGCCTLKGWPQVDTLDQDVQALKAWLTKAWRYLAQPSHTRFDRQEMRQQMKLVEAKLRIGLNKYS